MTLPVVEERHLLRKLDEQALPQLRLPIDPKGGGIKTAPPKLGQHSEQILREAGLSEAEILSLL